jgi:hypothetical protein
LRTFVPRGINFNDEHGDERMPPNYEGYVKVFGEAFREIIRERLAAGSPADSFEQGYRVGLGRAVSLMQQTAEIYDIPADDLGVADFDPDNF